MQWRPAGVVPHATAGWACSAHDYDAEANTARRYAVRRPAPGTPPSSRASGAGGWRSGGLAGISTNRNLAPGRKARGYEGIASYAVSQRKQGLETHRERQ
jgi:hypothetical protein